MPPAAPPSSPPVLLLHGMARTHLSLAGLGRALRRAGHQTWARSYPSRRAGVAELAELVVGWVEAELGPGPFDAVTHSLGGVLVRHMAARLPLRRVVMLAPPNGGSALARRLGDLAAYDWLYGPAGRDVQGGAGWPLVEGAEVAVIAGTLARSPGNPVGWLSSALGVFADAGPSDGTVAVAETPLPGMVDFATVPASHTWIMNEPAVRAMVVRFLAQGRLRGAGG